MTIIWNRLTAWLTSKGGLAHVLAAAYVFAVIAYANVPQFHALVVDMHQSLPAWLQELASTIVALVAFYKTWNSESGKKIPAVVPCVLVGILSLGLLTMSGCAHHAAAPLPAGAISSADAQINAGLQAAQAGLKQYEADVCNPAPSVACSPKHTPTDAEKAIVNDLINGYNAAYPIYQAWHAQLVIDPNTPEPSQLANLLVALAGDLSKIQTFLQGVK
jgi:hypothetical protein